MAVGIPVGSPPNLIAIAMVRELAGPRLTFFDWVLITLPLTIAMLAGRVARAPLALCARPGRRRQLARQPHRMPRAQHGHWTPGERRVAGVFGVAAVVWMLPGALALSSGPDDPILRLVEARLLSPSSSASRSISA